jgi:hypothetical protein
MLHWQFDDIIAPAAYLAEAERWVADGVRVIGGCYGIGGPHSPARRESAQELGSGNSLSCPGAAKPRGL